ncbi:uncharacterized protein NEMAJ01_1381 [Nematocida major]|uniref:uncharacterized protein n=1 Tax=Nematocida major TaxID=1912982 RepID=UPI002008A7D9|nr:uncharacterized protein NEMAJ01_1381 [Nematocida major]KAH9386485.1 hypothetical protein NEMAJ01_1381 [Nematocida major]
MIMNLRPQHEKLLREIYKRDGTVDEQKLSFFKHYLQQKPMKISESMNVLKEYTKKYAQSGQHMKHLTTITISTHLMQDYSIFCTSFEIAALKLIKTHLKVIIRVMKKSMSVYPEDFIDLCCAEIMKCFIFFTYAGTRCSHAESLSTQILLAICSAVDNGFTSAKSIVADYPELYERISHVYSGNWSTLSSINIRKRELEDERMTPSKEPDDESYSTDATASYNFAEMSYNYTEDKSSSSSSIFSAPEKTEPCRNYGKKEAADESEKPCSGIPVPPANRVTEELASRLQGISLSSNASSTDLASGKKEFIPAHGFVVKSNGSDRVSENDLFFLSLLSMIIKTAGLLVRHSEKKICNLNKALIKAAPFNREFREEIFKGYFRLLAPGSNLTTAIYQALEVSSEREIENMQNIIYHHISQDCYPELIRQANAMLAFLRTKMFDSPSTIDKNRRTYVFLLLQTVLFIHTTETSTPTAQISKSFYFLLRSLFPKKTLFRKVVLNDSDLQERGLTVKYFKLFVTKCQDKENLFHSLLRRAFQKELGLGTSTVPGDLKLLISKELESTISQLDKCMSLGLLEILLEIAASPNLQFREYINSTLELVIEKGILGKRSQFEEHKRISLFAKIRTHAITQGGLYISLLKKSIPTINKSEIKIVAGVFSVINEVTGLEECGKYVDISGTHYNIEDDNKLCKRASSVQGSSIRSSTTFGGVRKSSIRLFDMFKKLNK